MSDNKVVVYSKTTCPYCSAVKGLLADLKVDAKIIELNQMRECLESCAFVAFFMLHANVAVIGASAAAKRAIRIIELNNLREV